MRPFEELLRESSTIHGHLCAGQVLGVRMAMVGCREIGVEEPKRSKKLIVYVEIDRCATDAIQAVTGCSLGKRTLKFLDYGKMAASFVNLETGGAVRVVARDDARERAALYAPGIDDPRQAQKRAYAVMPENELFSVEPVLLRTPRHELPGAKSGRVFCGRCAEGINFKREVERDGEVLCTPCAQGSYLPTRAVAASDRRPRWIFVGGPSNAGKTTLIERLIPELAARGCRVGTVKHHHNGSPLVFDGEGKDSWRHRKAGADTVSLVSTGEQVLFRRLDGPPDIDRLAEDFGDVDLVLVEGFRAAPGPGIEVYRSNDSDDGDGGSEGLLVAALAGRGGAPRRFRMDDIAALADEIVGEVLNGKRG